ncbi:trichohyalin [Drosophila grimshawi]|uniref:trichohyalin n=1 Tax=Drosophila grimshawi TaxID=7222 RepID=UPI000C870670|nr:trichohyalin [Drosophila grimshawi]
MQNHGKGAEHFWFMQLTDRKSLHTQIGLLVKKAQETASEDLQDRCRRLKTLLDEEDKGFEQEFASKVRNRLDENIRLRQEQLHEIKEQRDQRHKKFVDMKRVQQLMVNCYEIREALRQKDCNETKLCQEQQMQENLRKKRRECERDNYWLKLNERRWADYDRQQNCEMHTREQVQEQICQVLQVQLAEHEEKRQQEREEKRLDTIKVDKLIEELRLEEFDEKHRAANKDKEKYRDELLEDIRRHKCEKLAEWTADKAEHEEFMRETQHLEAGAKKRIWCTKRELCRATHEYIAYVRRMRNLELGIEKMMNDRIDDLYHVDTCCKNNIAEQTRLKGLQAARCHAQLKQQICEEIERKMRLEAEHRENGIIENRFVHPPVTREMILCKYAKNRADLDTQIVEMKRIRAEEEKAFEQKLLKAVDDPEICIQLAAQYMENGTDYLPSHPNWKIHACPKNKYVPKAPMDQQQFDALIASAGIDKCPCPAAARHDCALMNQVCPNAPPKAPAKKLETGAGDSEPQTHKDSFKSCLCKPHFA